MLKCRGGLNELAERRSVRISEQAERLFDRMPAPHQVANGNPSARSWRSLQVAFSNKLIDELPSARSMDSRTHRAGDLVIGRSGTGS